MRLGLHRVLLRGAAILVPERERAEWLAEWTSELWYVMRATTPGGKWSAISFCLGALRDALWLRQNSLDPAAGRQFGLESPLQCVFLLLVLAGASLYLALRLPGIRDSVWPSPYQDARNLVMISRSEGFQRAQPTVEVEGYRALRGRAEFSGLAFYRPVTARLGAAEFRVAMVSVNLFEMLEVPVAQPGLFLSETAWRKWFDGDPSVAGCFVEVGGQTVRVAGVLPEGSWRLPGRFDAWLLTDEQRPDAPAGHSKGFVLGRVRAARAQHRSRWLISVPNEHGGSIVLECESLARQPLLLAHLLVLFIAILILPATMPRRLGEYPAGRRRWIFLAVKIPLLVVIVFCGTLDLAWIFSIPIQAHGLLIGYVLAFRWALMDQRRRCPVCLRLLANPVRIGWASDTLLEWYGTELMCVKGHGLLHVPEAETTYGIEWLHLDDSWNGLFSEPEESRSIGIIKDP